MGLAGREERFNFKGLYNFSTMRSEAVSDGARVISLRIELARNKGLHPDGRDYIEVSDYPIDQVCAGLGAELKGERIVFDEEERDVIAYRTNFSDVLLMVVYVPGSRRKIGSFHALRMGWRLAMQLENEL